ncbi:hypothetical protein ACWFRT_21520 [Streptomyces anulatus]
MLMGLNGSRPLRRCEGGFPARVVDGVRRVRRLVMVMVGVCGGRGVRGWGIVLRGGGCGAGGADRVAYDEAGDPGPLVPGRLPGRFAVGSGDPPPVGLGEIGGVEDLVGSRGAAPGWTVVVRRVWSARARFAM